jgi:hypothetical protein
MPDGFLVPDVAGAIVGRRCWGLAQTRSGIRLVSRGDVIWPTESALEAACEFHTHTPPAERCTGGIYALSSSETFPYYGYDGATYAVFGEVFLWGEVVRGTKGYRAQFAFPKSLFMAHRDWQYTQHLRDAYDVPVTLTNPYTIRSH